MDEIEYLEEYEDLILPTMSAHSTVTKNRVNTNQLTTNMADDEDSSSIDQDIFESLFDDHSDDESIMQKKLPAKLSQRSERSSRVSRMSMDSLDMLVKDLGEPLNATADQQNKATSKPSTKPSTTKPNQSTGKVMPKAATASAPTTTKAASTSSHTTKDINNKTATKSDTAATKSTIDERNARTKSVATVRPTVQQTTQSSAKQTNSNTAATSSATTSTTYRTSLNATTASSKQDAKDTNATVSSSNKPTTATISTTAARKQVAAATSTTGNTGSNSTVGSSNSKANASGASAPKRIVERSQTTIIKPEKPQIKDPAEDPLSLENVDNETDSDTESFLYSDISADTFVSLSDVDEDDEERQVIELSNDSNYDRVNLELAKKGLRATPSTTNAATIAQKLIREQPNSNRNLTVTPTSTTRKRVRDIPQHNTTAEKNDPDKSPLEKKTKIDSFRKSSRLHEEGETSGSEIDSSAASQRRSRVAGIKDNPTNKNIRDNSTSLERKAAQQPATKENVDADINETTIRSQSPRKRDKSTTNNTNSGKSQAPTTTTTTSATAEANKKRTKQALENMQPTKKALRANENETLQQQQQQQQRQAAMTQRSTTKQSAASTSTTAIQQQQQHAETNEASGDPLQIPTKRVRRLQAIDSYDAINATSELSTSKAAEELEKQNMANLPKRKSLRAVATGPSDGAKPNEGNKMQVKQQAQQQQQPSTRIVETNRVTANRSTTNTLKTQISPTKSSPASKVLTFTEWLEQQKKNGEPKRGEEVETTAQAKEIATRAKANLDTEKSNVLTATVSAAAAASSSKPTEVMNITVSGSEKELRQRAAAANKRKEFSSTAGNNAQMAEMTKATTAEAAAARQTRMEKTVGVGANSANDTNTTNATNTKSAANRTTTQFKRPSLPQKQAARSTKPSAGGNRTPTQMQGNNNNAPHNGKQSELHKVNIKSKLRKLRVRINRSTVPAYFRKINLALSRGQEKNDVEQKFSTPADTALPDNATKPQRPPLPITQKRVPMRSAIQVQKQLPTLTARPTVAAASSTNKMSRVGGSLPPLTKVPSPLERIATRHQDDMNSSQNTTTGYQHNNTEELSLLTPMKSVAVPTTTNTSRSQQQQQKSQLASSAAAEAIREKRTSATSSTDTSNSTTRTQATVAPANTNSNLTKDTTTTTAFIPFVPKEEIVDEQQQQQQHTTQAVVRTSNTAAAATAADSSSVSTNSLASRTLAIAAATNSALSQPATSDPSGYYGLTPTQLDANGTRLYSFLHPAKYNRNHGCVLLDYCCPNLDGPMPAIDPTRIHAQVQAGVRELPAYIVMTTKLITRADLEANKSVIPASIRQKVEKITADAQSVSNQMPPSVPGAAVNGTPNLQNALTSKPPQIPNATSTAATVQAKSTLTPTITALQKHLPSTTSITPKLMPPSLTSASSSSTSTAVAAAAGTSSGSGTPTPNGPTSGPHMLLSDYQRSVLRTSVRQFDARLKKYYYRIALLSFSDRQKIIDNLITTTTLIPKDVECAVRLLDEYAAQIATLPNAPTAATGPVNAKPTGATAQSTSKAIITPTTNTVPTARTNMIQQQQLQQQHHHQQLQQQNQRNSNGQGAVLDKDNSLLGYQLASSTSATMALNQSTVSTRSSIMSTGFKNTSMPNVSTASGGVLPALKSAQDSPRIFYTKHPMQTSTPIATTTSSANTSMSGGKSISLRSTPRLGRDMTIRQMPTTLASVSSTSVTSTPPATRRLPALTRNPHLSTSNTATPNSSATETITTRSAVTISTAPKRMTRASAAAKVIVITQNSEGGANTPSDECILPDEHNNTEIKREKMDDDFVGGN